MLHDVLFALWFFLPAGAANVMPIFVAKIPFLERYTYPIDFSKTFRGKRILGDHKTWRGLVFGILAATLTLWLQQVLVDHYAWAMNLTNEVDYTSLPVLILGPLFAIGALGGDAVESFFKRQRGVAPGKGWFPFDQIDYIIGGALVTMPFVTLSILQYVWLIVLWLIVHVISTIAGYLLGLKDSPI